MRHEPAATPDVALQAIFDKQQPIISRLEAKTLGLKKYFSGRICPEGHIFERWVRNYKCIKCEREKARQWYAANSDKAIDASRRWVKNNPDKRSQHKKTWRTKNLEKYSKIAKKWGLENPERKREAARKWRAKNKETLRAYTHKRRALKLNAGGSYTGQQITDLFKKQKGKCVNCLCSIKNGYHIDHIVALSKGGSNYITNIQLLCQRCNNIKHDKDPIVWAQQNGRLL